MKELELRLAKNLAMPPDAVTQTFAIFGKRGSGKTNGATVMVEEMLKQDLPVVILDPVDAWWGLKSSFDGKRPGLPVYIFGGQHADLPLESTAGTLLADLIAKEHLPCVFSMKLWGVAERARFVTDFARRLLQVNADPVMVVLEEADAFVPQRPGKGEEAMLGAMDRLVRWGRQSGVGCTLITQRSAKVNKDVTTQAETLIAFRTTGPQDREAIDNWIKFHAGDELRAEMLASLPTLASGTAWVWSPEWLGVFEQVSFRRRETYDSAATPKVGEHRPRPKQLADVDLDRLRAQMAATIEKAKAEDPRELRKKISELEGRLRKKAPAAIDPQMLEKARSDGERVAERRLQPHIDKLTKAIELALKSLHSVNGFREQPINLPPREAKAAVMGAPKTAVSERRIVAASGPGEKMAGGERRILSVLAQYPQGRTDSQIALLAGYAVGSGGFNNLLSSLRTKGWAEGQRSNLRITDAGVEALGEFEPLPAGRELLEYWFRKLGKAERSILGTLADAHPETLSDEEIAERSGYTAGSGGFNNAISRLRTLELISGGRKELKASDDLF